MAHVCPWWIGYFLVNPLRKLFQDPDLILGPFVRTDMTVLEVGPGMGYFSLPMARMVGPGGRVVCVDIQEKMLNTLKKRANSAGLVERLDCRPCDSAKLPVDDLAGTVDFVLLFAMVHEVPDPAGLFRQLYTVLKPAGRILLGEPRGHVTRHEFIHQIQCARDAGFYGEYGMHIWRTRAVILARR